MRTLLFGTLGFLSLVAIGCGGNSPSTSTTGGTTSSSTGSGGTGGEGGASTSSTTSASSTSSTSSSSSSSGAGGGSNALDGFTESAAKSICSAVFRCCDAQSTSDYFNPYAKNTLLTSFAAQIPPKQAFANEAACAATLKQMLDITPFGDWVAQAKAGHVTFNQAAFDACKTQLDGAACGKDVGTALFDSTCFGLAPPAGGPLQRSSFQRIGKAGDACDPIHDGIGGSLFGTCEPTSSFCCYVDAQAPGTCALAFDSKGASRAGTCKAVSKVGEACKQFGSLQLCATGTNCDSGTGKCVSDSTAPLMTGDACVTANFTILGDCQGSWCDVNGTKKCEPFKADGSACSGGDECQSTACVMKKCGAPTFCEGP